MAIETITVAGQKVETLRELLRPGLKAVIVGINPAVVSVEASHYYQGRLGKRLWQRLREEEVLHDLPEGAEDDAAFAQGFGFADLVRRPSPRDCDLALAEKRAGASELVKRLLVLESKPLIIFVFAEAEKFAGPLLREQGFETVRLPGPYAKNEYWAKALADIAERLKALA